VLDETGNIVLEELWQRSKDDTILIVVCLICMHKPSSTS
jgi:hypothetical protein